MIRLLLLALCWLACAPLPAAAQSAGESIYRNGVLPSGLPLRGERATDRDVEGRAIACVACHRRSGLGTSEGTIAIPPITGAYLFHPRGKALADVDFRYSLASAAKRPAYTDATLARAIRDGIDAGGRPLNSLMPRFPLDDGTMALLIAYLKSLGTVPAPGVTADTLHFATIITPDADPAARQGMLDVLQHFFADKNEFLRGGVKPLRSSFGIMFRVTRRWQLHVWQLTGAPKTWEAQLREHLAREPVFAVISGLGGKTWAPVHRFCEEESLPCLFPNVALPVDAESDFYSMYFSKGVLLEAELLAHELAKHGPRRLVQIYRRADIGEPAAGALRAALKATAKDATEIALPAGAGAQDLAAALGQVRANDELVLWLRPQDLESLPPAVPGAAVYVSGLMGGLESAPLPAAWKAAARMAYPLDLPERRRFRMNYPLGWFKVRHIPVVSERVQADTYLACGILSETLSEMLDSFVRDYLVERIEVMLSRRIITGYYPRLGLAPGERFASKGGYIVRFDPGSETGVAAASDWIVP